MEIAEPEQQLGRYRIERTLGAGGMGVVYLALDTKLQRPVAIKKLRKDATSTTAAQRIQSEAQLLAQLNHPNIVQLHDVIEDGDGIALVMEYVEGATLQQWMREYTPSLQQKLELLIQICDGLTEAHSLGIIHRDLKSDNILITENGKGGITAKITDFGIAKSLQQDSATITREDHVAGTVDAMSPEQLQGYPLCPRSDLFSLGTIAYELLCSSKPFEKGEGGAMALAHKVVSDPHIPPQQAWPNLPEPLAVLLDKLLSKAPEQRPESAAQVAEALTFLHQLGADSDTRELSVTVTQLLRKPPNKRKRLLVTLAATVVGLAVLGTAGYWGWKEITRLEPQYIAVLPVEIHGEVRGEENAKALTATMVRQALMNATSQLKASALVSFTPKEGQDFDAQLQALRDKGVTDALFARLECAQVRCEIELQRIGPGDSQIKQQASFAFLADKRQESQFRITNSGLDLFSNDYRGPSATSRLMSNDDYSEYLNIISRLDSRNVSESDLSTLYRLSDSYPESPTLYRTIIDAAFRVHAATGDDSPLNQAARKLDDAINYGIDSTIVSKLKLLLYSTGNHQEKFEALSATLKQSNFPVAELRSMRARHFYRKGEYQKGLLEAQEAAALNPSAENQYLIALNQIASGDYANARLTLKKLNDNYPEHWSSYSALGVIELESGNLQAAETAITAIPEDLRGWRTSSNLGVVYFLQQKYPEALQTYQQVLGKVPNNVPAVGQIAETYLMLGDTENARKTFEELLGLTKEKEGLAFKRYQALAHANLGNASAAIPMVHELLKEAPEDKYVKYAAAQVYALSREWRSANYYLDQLLKQGMSSDWFRLPAFRQLCDKESTTAAVAAAVCD